MKIRKAVIPAAGLGTRVLPASKSIPKEMLPIVDKPVIQYIVEEAVKAGITEILIITGRGKGAIEDHFDRSPELEERLLAGGKQAIYDEIRAIPDLANITFVRQKETKGLGHAVLCAKEFVGDEPFAVLYGDDVIIGENSATAELCAAYEKHGKGVVGIKEVPHEMIHKYSSLKADPIGEREFLVTDMIEKPRTEAEVLSYYSILEHTEPGAGGEIQLTDAMLVLARRDGMIGVDYTGTRYDMGNKLGILQAAVEVGLKHPEVGEDFRNYLKKLAETL